MPKQSFNSGGWRSTGRVRVRTTWLGFAVLEGEREYHDGMRLWAKLPGYRIIADEACIATRTPPTGGSSGSKT